MYLIEIRASETNVLTCRAEEFDGNIDLNFINGLKAYISDEERDTGKALALCAAVEARTFLIKNQITDEIVFDGLIKNVESAETNGALVTQANQELIKETGVSTSEAEVIKIAPPEVNFEGLNNLDLVSALQEQIKVIDYLTALNNVIKKLAQAKLSEIPARRAALDQAESLFSTLVGNPLLGVIKKNELGEISLNQAELENLINLFSNRTNSPA